MNEEKYIEERVGKRNPFLVPDGYFESFADRMMQQLPEQPVREAVAPEEHQQARTARMRLWLYAAACALVLVVSVWLWQSLPDASVATQLAAQQEQVSDASFDEAADYMMLDNQDIYTYLAEN